MDQQFAKLVFDMWMSEHYPNYYTIVGKIAIVFVLAFICSIVFIWFFAWWWKMMLTVLGLSLIALIANKVVLTMLVNEFASNDKK